MPTPSVTVPKLAHGSPRTPGSMPYYIHTKGNNPMNTNTRYQNQVREDRKAAALQRRLDREATGMADVDLVNRIYNRAV